MTDRVNYYQLVQGSRQFAEIILNENDGLGLRRELYYMIDSFDDGSSEIQQIPLTILWHSEAGPIESSKVKKELKERVKQVMQHNEEDK